MTIKVVLWALDFTPNKYLEDILSSQLREEVVFIGVGALQTADEILSAMKELKASEVVTAIEDPCEVQKLLDEGVQPLVAIIEEICNVTALEECKEYDPSRDIVVEDGGKVVVLRVHEFSRIIDIMFQLVEPHERHEHEEGEQE
ncbi:MAG: hypothetical protein ABWK01_09485 [Infirmifilum sp.]